MSSNPQLTYQDILVETDKEARDEYEFDPRAQIFNQPLGPEVPAKDVEAGADVDTGYTLEEIQANSEYNTHSDMKIVQAPPKLIPKKHVVIIDTAQRDWVKQANAYEFSFYFNSPGVNDPSTVIRTPIYENNKYIPINAIENEAKIDGQLNVTKRLRPQYTRAEDPLPIPTTPETVYDNRGKAFTQNVISPFAYYGFSLQLDDGQIIFFNTYDKDASQGRIITYDIVSNEYNENFSTRQTLANVTSIRTIKAVLPNRRFINFKPTLYNSDNSISSFASEPYLLLKINNFQGYYNGGNDPVSSAFSVLSQSGRTVQTTLANQFQDYFPLVDEAYKFNAPLSYIPKFDISLMNNIGKVYNQFDDIVITKITCESSTESEFIGNNKALVLKCSIKRPNSTFYNINELRPGDRITFHKPSLSKVIANSDVSVDQAYRSLFLWLSNNDAIVLGNTSITNEEKSSFLQEFTFIYDPITTYGTVPEINKITDEIFPIVLSPGITGPSKINLSKYGKDFSLPIMNTNMQSMFSFEVITMEPDISHLGGSGAR